MLKFKDANGKLKKMSKKLGLKLKTFTLPAGYTCPGAKDCLAYADRKTGKVKDGKETQFRCFMASLEATFPSLRAMVWENYEQLQVTLKNGVDACADLIHNSLPKKFDVMRVHVGGDYFSKEYLQAWIEVAKRNPDKVFYSYSKSLHLFREFALPENLVLTASRGGKYDDLIDLHAWKEAVVVFSEKEAADKDLEIDHDDSHAAFGAKDFALLIHGTQPAGSIASEALKLIKKKARA
tara:strand:+ start:498 stop:1208 length:711 start_codon:yes stop_codon:yes gene_type:complete